MDKIPLAEQMFGMVQGQGAYYWTTAIKKIRATNIPESRDEQAAAVTEDLAVKILETSFAEQDTAIENAAKAEAMFWSTDPALVMQFLEL